MGLRILWTVFCILQDSKLDQQKFPSFRNPFYEARKVKHILLQGNSFCFTKTWRGWCSTTSYIRTATLSWVSDTIVYFTAAMCTRECTRASVIRKVTLQKFLHTIRNSKFSFRFSHLKHSWRQRVLSVSKCKYYTSKIKYFEKKKTKTIFQAPSWRNKLEWSLGKNPYYHSLRLILKYGFELAKLTRLSRDGIRRWNKTNSYNCFKRSFIEKE